MNVNFFGQEKHKKIILFWTTEQDELRRNGREMVSYLFLELELNDLKIAAVLRLFYITNVSVF